MTRRKLFLIFTLMLAILLNSTIIAFANNTGNDWWKDGSPGDAYNVLAKIAYVKGDYNKAYNYGLKSVKLYSWKHGGQGEAYLLASIAAKKTGRMSRAEELGALALKALEKSGQVTGSKNVEFGVSVYVISYMENLKKFQVPQTQLQVPPDSEIIQIPGLPAIFKHQLPHYMNQLNILASDLMKDNPKFVNLIKSIQKILNEITATIINGKPISPEKAAQVGGAIAALLAGTNIYDTLARRRYAKYERAAVRTKSAPVNRPTVPGKTVTNNPPKFEKPGGLEPTDKTFGVGKDKLYDINKIIGDAISGGNLTDVLNNIQDLSNDLLVAGNNVDRARDALNRIIKEGTRIGLGGEIIRTNPAEYEKALAEWLRAKGTQNQIADDLARLKDKFQTGRIFKNYGAQILGGFDKGLTLGGVFINTLENMSPTFTPDGKFIEGDAWYYAIGKGAGSTAINTALGNANPGLGLMEFANFIAFGGSKAGDIISPSNTISGTFNFLTDKFVDLANGTNNADLRLQGQHYGANVTNFIDGGRIAGDAINDPVKFSGEWAEVVKDKSFYEGMYESTFELFKPPQDAGFIKRGFLWAGETTFGTIVGIAEGAGQFGTWAGSNETINKGIDIMSNAAGKASDGTSKAVSWFGSFFGGEGK